MDVEANFDVVEANFDLASRQQPLASGDLSMEALLACLGGEATEPARRCVAALLRGHVETTLAALPGVPPSSMSSSARSCASCNARPL